MGQVFHYQITFLIHHDIVLGLRLRTKTKKMLSSQSAEFEVGSFPPTIVAITKDLEECEVPTGKMSRGSCAVTAELVDEKKRKHISFTMKLKIEKA